MADLKSIESRWRLWIATIVLAFSVLARAEDEAGTAVYAGKELLKDYRPTPTLVTKRTLVQRPKFPAIDIHCHWSLMQDPQFLLTSMDKLGVKAAINLSGGYGKELDAMLEKFSKAAPDRLLIFCNLDFKTIDEPDYSPKLASYIEEAHAKGVRGLKIFKSLGLTVKDKSGKVVPIDDPRLDAAWAKCGELHMPVLIHAADPIAFFQPIDEHNERWMQLKRHPDWSFYGPEFPKRDEVLAQRNHIVEQYPQTVFIGAHVASSDEDLAQIGRWLDQYPNLYVDISGRVSELGRKPYSARKFLIQYQDRILFGTDRYPGRPDQPRYTIYYRFLETADEYFDYYNHPFPPEGEWKIYGVFLPDEVLEKIYHLNAERALAGKLPLAASATTQPAAREAR